MMGPGAPRGFLVMTRSCAESGRAPASAMTARGDTTAGVFMTRVKRHCADSSHLFSHDCHRQVTPPLVIVDMEQEPSMKREHLSFSGIIILGLCVVLTDSRLPRANRRASARPAAGGERRNRQRSFNRYASCGPDRRDRYRPVTGSNGETALARARTIGSGSFRRFRGYIGPTPTVVSRGRANRRHSRAATAIPIAPACAREGDLVGVTDELESGACSWYPIEGLPAVHSRTSNHIRASELEGLPSAVPDGLRNSFSMVMGRAVAQIDEDSPFPYVRQTPPINPGTQRRTARDTSATSSHQTRSSARTGRQRRPRLRPAKRARHTRVPAATRETGHLLLAITGLSVPERQRRSSSAGLRLAPDSGLCSNVAQAARRRLPLRVG
jgi:hypothetical protein